MKILHQSEKDCPLILSKRAAYCYRSIFITMETIGLYLINANKLTYCLPWHIKHLNKFFINDNCVFMNFSVTF